LPAQVLGGGAFQIDVGGTFGVGQRLDFEIAEADDQRQMAAAMARTRRTSVSAAEKSITWVNRMTSVRFFTRDERL